jgi:hypothetical protein
LINELRAKEEKLREEARNKELKHEAAMKKKKTKESNNRKILMKKLGSVKRKALKE